MNIIVVACDAFVVHVCMRCRRRRLPSSVPPFSSNHHGLKSLSIDRPTSVDADATLLVENSENRRHVSRFRNTPTRRLRGLLLPRPPSLTLIYCAHHHHRAINT